MATTQNTQFIVLRSTDRSSGTQGDAYFDVPALDLPKDHSVFLVSIGVPYSFYNIDANNNRFAFRETGSLTQTATFLVEPGNYSSAELASYLQGRMTTLSPNGKIYTVSYDYKTGHMTFDTGDAATTVEFETVSMDLKMFLSIGFYNEGVGGITPDGSTVGQVITSKSYCHAAPSHLTVESSLRFRGHHTLYRTSDMLANIPLRGGPGDLMIFEPSDRIELLFENAHGHLRNIRITFKRDDTGQVVDSFNGIPWVVTLGVRGVEM